MSTVYVFGAGASAAEKAPTVQNFFEHSYRHLNQDENIKPVWTFLSQYYQKDLRNVTNFKDEFPQIDEVISTIDWAIHNNISLMPGHDQQYLTKLKRSLILLMSKTLDMALSENSEYPTKHDRFIGRLSLESSPKGIDIVSLNYDLLLDHAIARKIGNLPDYGLTKKRALKGYRLYKLHGSLNWAVCPFCQQIKVYDEKIAHKLFDKYEKCQECSLTKLEPVLITPTMLKSYNIPELPKVWAEAFHAISSAKKLVFIGYSLPPADFAITELFKRGIHMKGHLEEVHVIDVNPEMEQRYKKVFGGKLTTNFKGFQGEVI